MRPRSNTYKEVNSRPHSSISMLYTDPWSGEGAADTEHGHHQAGSAAARTERQFHTLERETSRHGRHRHPGQLDSMQLESSEQQERFDDSIDSLDMEEQELLHCLTPAPDQFNDHPDKGKWTILH